MLPARSIGKSMLSRKAIDEIRATHGPLTVTVDGARTGHGPEAFLRQLAKIWAPRPWRTPPSRRSSSRPSSCFASLR